MKSLVAERLNAIADNLNNYGKMKFGEIQKLVEVANEFEQSWSASWLGYHSRVYYRNFTPPPAGCRFSREWGLKDTFSEGTIGDWVEYSSSDVIKRIEKIAGNPDLEKIKELGEVASQAFEEGKTSAISLVHASFDLEREELLKKLTDEINAEEIYLAGTFIESRMPRGQLVSRDAEAIYDGPRTPPHIKVWAKALAADAPFRSCESLAKKLRKLAIHSMNLQARQSGKNPSKHDGGVFIGHGRSPVWRELKDFLQDRLKLPWEEFNRIPVAGKSTTDRLAEMLDNASFAFLIMTAEDDRADGKLVARQNVVHETGLFQGRLGFGKAIILLEEGCEEFSNIHGLGQIRFKHNDIASAFEDIRRVLEREKII